tara:strand:- start:458 stop:796 length:339 start_codon:yes stop_codon:yes gene_type:complete
MGLRTKVELSWRGVEYPLLVTMEVIDRVDDKLNIGKLLTRYLANDVRHSHSAKFLSLMLNEAGAKTTQEEVHMEMFSSEGVTLSDVKEFNELLLGACFHDSKKKEAQEEQTK